MWVLYNDSRITYNESWLTYNWLWILSNEDTSSTWDSVVNWLISLNIDTQSQTEFIELLLAKVLLVSDYSTTSDDKELSISWINKDNSVMSDESKNVINLKNIDTSISTEDVTTLRVMLVSVSDTQISTDNTNFDLSMYKTDILSTIDMSMNTVEFIKKETVTTSDTKLIDTLLKNIDIVYTTEDTDVFSIILKKTRPWIINIKTIKPSCIDIINKKTHGINVVNNKPKSY